MMTRGFAERTTAWEQADPVLARKMNYIRNFIRGLNPSMDVNCPTYVVVAKIQLCLLELAF